MKVLITDVESRKAFDIVNIMQHKYHYDCILCSGKGPGWKLEAIYGQKVFRLRGDSYPKFSEDLKQLVSIFPTETLVYLPVSEEPTRNLLRFLDSENFPNLHSLLPPVESFEIASDKGRFQQYCEQKNFPVPCEFTLDSLSKSPGQFTPVLLKPKKGQGSVGICHIDAPEDLTALKSISESDYIIQQKIISSSKVSGAFFLCLKGETITAYTHKRIRTFPANGGVTVYSEATRNKEILTLGAQLLKSLNWTGLAMIEFLYDEISREWKIIELNPRLWGSIMLAPFAGSPILKNYVETCIGLKPSLDEEYREGVFIRWLLPFDLLNLLSRQISLGNFLNMNYSKTCYINFTYSPIFRSLAYLAYFSFNMNSIRRFFKKLS